MQTVQCEATLTNAPGYGGLQVVKGTPARTAEMSFATRVSPSPKIAALLEYTRQFHRLQHGVALRIPGRFFPRITAGDLGFHPDFHC